MWDSAEELRAKMARLNREALGDGPARRLAARKRVRRGRPPKTLEQHIRDRTFIAARHADLLERESLPDDAPRPLLELQTLYGMTRAVRIRKAIAVEFAETVRTVPVSLTSAQSYLGRAGPFHLNIDLDDAELMGLYKTWLEWDREHGPRWRRLHGVPHDTDHAKLKQAADGWPPHPPGWDLLPEPY